MYKIEFLIKQATRYCHILPGHIDSLNLIPAPFVSLVCISSILDRRLSTFHGTNRIPSDNNTRKLKYNPYLSKCNFDRTLQNVLLIKITFQYIKEIVSCPYHKLCLLITRQVDTSVIL